MPWLMLAKMPLLISSRMTSAGLTPRRSARSLTVMLDGSSMAVRSRDSAVCTAPGTPLSRRIGLRGPLRPRVPLLLLATTTSLFDAYRLPCQLSSELRWDWHFQRSLERPFVERRLAALRCCTKICPASGQLACRIDDDTAVWGPDHARQFAFLRGCPANNA